MTQAQRRSCSVIAVEAEAIPPEHAIARRMRVAMVMIVVFRARPFGSVPGVSFLACIVADVVPSVTSSLAVRVGSA
jgi:hypothetical protein